MLRYFSSWAEKQKPLVEWLVDELNAKYTVPKKIAQAWVEGDELLLLDGLDEVKAERREACVGAINAFRQEHGLVPKENYGRHQAFHGIQANEVG